jgi:spore maturation protein CgeB
LPAGASVLVISKGDNDLLELEGRCGWHFPQTAAGVYAGHHPADDAEAIRHLEDLKTRGAGFLLIPAAAFWWLDHYKDFRRHLDSQYRRLACQEDTCLIYDLSSLPSAGQAPPVTSSPDKAHAPFPAPLNPPPTGPGPASPALATALPAGSSPSGPAPDRAGIETSSPAGGEPHPHSAPARPTLGCILDEFTAACLGPECALVTFRPDNWKERLDQHRIDLLLVESAWQGNGGSWQYKIASMPQAMGEELVEVVNYCKARRVPTVFWNKEDPPHFGRFIHRASLFDAVFTSDADLIPKYRQAVRHDRVYGLSFAAQPGIHHPILETDRVHNVCFAGAYYATDHDERRLDMEHILRPALAFGLHIYDRQHGLAGPHAQAYQFPEIYQAAIQGRLDYQDMIKAYKWYKVFLNVNCVKDSPTMFSRRVFELLASGTPVISSYSRGIVEMLGKDLVSIANSAEETCAHLEELLHDENHWARVALKGLREVVSRHTYGHRLAEICAAVQVPFEGVREPVVAVAVQADASQDLRRLARTLARQTYRKFRLLLLAGDKLTSAGIETMGNTLPDIMIHLLPSGSGGSDLLARAAGADYAWFPNLRDFYGNHFLKDAVLAARYSEADVIGKKTHYAADADDSVVRLNEPGFEYRWVSMVNGPSAIVKVACLEAESWQAGAAGLGLSMAGRRVLSIDRFNYVRGGAGLEGAPSLAVACV